MNQKKSDSACYHAAVGLSDDESEPVVDIRPGRKMFLTNLFSKGM